MPVSQAYNPPGYFAVAHVGCTGCAFRKRNGECLSDGPIRCGASVRDDATSVIFKKGKAPKPKLDKDAAWLMKRVDDMEINNIDAYVTKAEVVSRLRRIAKRLNGGKLP